MGCSWCPTPACSECGSRERPGGEGSTPYGHRETQTQDFNFVHQSTQVPRGEKKKHEREEKESEHKRSQGSKEAAAVDEF